MPFQVGDVVMLLLGGGASVVGIITYMRINARAADSVPNCSGQEESQPLPDVVEVDGVQAHPSRVRLIRRRNIGNRGGL